MRQDDSRATRARAAAERLSAPHRPVPAPIFERRRRVQEQENDGPMYDDYEEMPMRAHAEPTRRGCGAAVTETLFYLVLIAIVLGFAAWVIIPYAAAYLASAPAQTITTTTRPQVAPSAPRSVPAVAPEKPQDAPYDNAAYNATADALRGAQEAQPVEAAPPADVPTIVPEWHAPLALPADGVPSACATWHAPLPYPQECAAWHAPLVTP